MASRAEITATIQRAFPQFKADEKTKAQVLTVGEFQELLHHRREKKVAFIMSSFCRDELSTDTAENAHCAASGLHHKTGATHTADHFPFGGLAGVCSCGDTAYGAAAHHVPTEGDPTDVVALVGGPHISFRELPAKEITRLTPAPPADVKDVKSSSSAGDAKANPSNPLLPDWTVVYGADGQPTKRRGYWGSMYRAQMTGSEGSACGAMVGYVDTLAVRAQNRPAPAAVAVVAAAAAASTVPESDAHELTKPKLTLPVSDPEQNELGRVMNQQLCDDALSGKAYLPPLNKTLRLWDTAFKAPDVSDERAKWELSTETALQRALRAFVMSEVTRAAVDSSSGHLPLVADRVHEKMGAHARDILLIDCLAVHWNTSKEDTDRVWRSPHHTTLYVAVRERIIEAPPVKQHDKPCTCPNVPRRAASDGDAVSNAMWSGAVRGAGAVVGLAAIVASATYLFRSSSASGAGAKAP